MSSGKSNLVTNKLISIFKQYGIREIYNPHQIVFTKNEDAINLYYIQSGLIRVYMPYTDGSERTLCYFSRNTIIGEDAFNHLQKRIVCTDAINRTILYRFSAKNLLQKINHDPELISDVLTFFMHKITLLHTWLFYAQFQRNEDKIACLLYTASISTEYSIKLTHHQIAEVTGMSRVTATRILNAFAQKGIISIGYKNLKVLNKSKLLNIFENKEFYGSTPNLVDMSI